MKRYFDSWKQCGEYLWIDTYRYIGDYGGVKVCDVFHTYIRRPEYRYIVWMRLAQYAIGRPIMVILKLYSSLRLQMIRNRTGIQISPSTQIGKGFYIGHFGSIVINPAVSIGECCNIIQTCTLGLAYRGKNEGVPHIGDRVHIGPGARLIGNVKVGNDVAIGANAVVTKDAPDNSVVAGVPAKILSMEGSEGYIYNQIDKDGIIHPRFEWKMNK